MLKLQKQHNEMNHKVLQDSMHLQNEVKGILEDINNGKDNELMKKHSSDYSTRKHPRLEGSRIIEHEKKKQALKC